MCKKTKILKEFNFFMKAFIFLCRLSLAAGYARKKAALANRTTAQIPKAPVFEKIKEDYSLIYRDNVSPRTKKLAFALEVLLYREIMTLLLFN